MYTISVGVVTLEQAGVHHEVTPRLDEEGSYMEESFADLITGCWGAVITAITPTCWSWMPRIPVIAVCSEGPTTIEIEKRLSAAGFVPQHGEPVATICQFFGVGVIFVVYPDDQTVLWVMQEVQDFATSHPVVLGFAPLVGRLPGEKADLPPAEYGTRGVWWSGQDPQVLTTDQIGKKGVETLGLMRALIKLLSEGYVCEKEQQRTVILLILFFRQQWSLLELYDWAATHLLERKSGECRSITSTSQRSITWTAISGIASRTRQMPRVYP